MRHSTPLLAAGLVLLAACETSVEPFDRGNWHDPKGDAYRPNVPTVLQLVGRTDGIELRWNDNSAFEDGYLIEKSPELNVSPTTWRYLVVLPPNTTSFVDTSGASGFGTFYRVSAFRRDEASLHPSGYVTASILAGYMSRLKIERAGAGGVRLSWHHQSDVERGFVVAVDPGVGRAFTDLAVLPPNTETYVHEQAPLSFGPGPTYRVAIFYGVGRNRVEFGSDWVYVPDHELFAPSHLTVDFPDDAFIRVTWDGNAPFWSHIEVDQELDGRPREQVTLGPEATSYLVRVRLRPGALYVFRVTAFDREGHRSQMAMASVTFGGPPAARE